jgi:hypothetical protein
MGAMGGGAPRQAASRTAPPAALAPFLFPHIDEFEIAQGRRVDSTTVINMLTDQLSAGEAWLSCRPR